MVSVLIPMHNSAAYIERCIESVLSQTYQDLEIILVDDGSEDNTIDIVNKYVLRDSRIQLYKQTNKGVAAARNECLKHANGNYIQFVDSDDWIESNMFQVMLYYMDEKTSIVFCGNDKAKSPKEVKRNNIGSVEILNRQEQLVEFLKHKKITGMLWNKLIRKELFNGVKFDETIGYGEDAQGLWQVLQGSTLMKIVPEVLYHHTDNPTGISDQKYSHVKFLANIVWSNISSDVLNKFPEYYPIVQERVFATAVYSRYEMIRSKYTNTEEKKYLIKVARNNICVLFRPNELTLKQKAFSVLTVAGI